MADQTPPPAPHTGASLKPGWRFGKDATLAEKRALVSSLFVTVLIGIAYQEMFTPVRDSVRASGLTAGTTLLALTFFLTSMRFFIGNQLHLLSDAILELRGDAWLFDFLVITLESVVLCFLGGVSSVEVNGITRVNFFDLLTSLYALDIIWIACQWLFGLGNRAWKRRFVPWAWALLNAGFLGAIVLLRAIAPNDFATAPLGALLMLSVIAFVVDMVLIDHYDIV